MFGHLLPASGAEEKCREETIGVGVDFTGVTDHPATALRAI
jgi:hypothetical protein